MARLASTVLPLLPLSSKYDSNPLSSSMRQRHLHQLRLPHLNCLKRQPQHENNRLPLQRRQRRRNPLPNRRRPKLLGKIRRLGMQQWIIRSAESRGYNSGGFAEVF